MRFKANVLFICQGKKVFYNVKAKGAFGYQSKMLFWMSGLEGYLEAIKYLCVQQKSELLYSRTPNVRLRVTTFNLCRHSEKECVSLFHNVKKTCSTFHSSPILTVWCICYNSTVFFLNQGFSQRPVHLSFGHPILILDPFWTPQNFKIYYRIDRNWTLLHRMHKSSILDTPISKCWLNPCSK